ncbi:MULTISPECIES: DeoR/GlpR family DNA-binding transcription regulator [Lactococcus]|jgi:DeoR family transcriptional regulator, carbon catabolite repression regulator|uniref:DeoR/GlpR family DNA-binding transcription regulator n=1 Tax=Lactococcus TaxID=1357 RepID=UPI001CDCCF46|nr:MULTISPECIES: DeoR/GlpR family DNA-binding transcription regulator [Lactococcus]MCA2390751.1 DeoR/GlpR family DNA-binding transcription regulator [Lactococcus sp. NH2-7C]MCI1070604.1 DeoR/GlpR family DNA-binding transcription regulator [Lactococcus lactis]MCT1193990.1 DeoR/GlpR transcriptional regulator [Lactococcus lactis]WGV30892.1 DeoR/GlpR family DNA-binding transcription regulator [Lactococcus sp. NH2-7C]
MYQEQRLNAIIAELSVNGELSVVKAMKKFNVSRDTIRRDFTILSEKKLAKRTHGGLISIKSSSDILSFNERLIEMSEEKINIAKQAKKLIRNNGIYFFDVSTIVLALGQILNPEMKITIYSHALDLAILMSDKPNIEFHLLGGKFYSKNRFFFSLNEIELLKNVNFDAGFFGAAGLRDGEVSFDDEKDVFVKKIAMKQSCQKILLAQTGKINLKAKYTLSRLESFDQIIDEKNGES